MEQKEKVIKFCSHKAHPVPTDRSYIIVELVRDLKRDDISTNGSLKNYVKGTRMWISMSYADFIGSAVKEIIIENNQYGANVPGHYFKIIEKVFVDDVYKEGVKDHSSNKCEKEEDNFISPSVSVDTPKVFIISSEFISPKI